MKRNKKDIGNDNLLDRKGEVYGYVRISTDLQDISKQRDMIDGWCRRQGFKEHSTIEGGEISSSKSKTARKLDFLNTLKDGDILVCSEISRLSRSTLEILEMVDDRLVKPKGSIQYSKFDIYKDKIREWCRTGFSYSSQARALKMSHTALIHYVRTRKIYRGGGLRKY